MIYPQAGELNAFNSDFNNDFAIGEPNMIDIPKTYKNQGE